MSEGKAPRDPDGTSPAMPERGRDPGEDSVLQARIDRALAHWPEDSGMESAESEWETRVQRIEEYIAGGLPTVSESSVSDEDLYAPPLAEDREVVQKIGKITGGEPRQAPTHASISLRPSLRGNGAELRLPGAEPVASAEGVLEANMANQSSERDRDRRSLQDLAKLASNGGWGSNRNSGVSVGNNNDDDDSVIDLSALAREEAAQAAARAAAAPPSSGALPRTAEELPEARRTSAAAAPVVVVEKKSGGAWVAVGAIAAAAIVAGTFVMTRNNNRVPEPAAVAQNTVQPQTAQGNTTGAKDNAGGAAATATANSPSNDTAQAASEKTTTGAGGKAVAGGSASGKGVKADKEDTKTAAGGAPKEETPAAAAAPPKPEVKQPAPDSLEAQIRQAAGVTGPVTAQTEAAPTGPAPGSVPARPSSGAVQGAINRALPGARACLQPDDAVSQATITFKSDGSVASVGVSGGAAGTAAEGCIRAALMKAKVEPFSNPTFSMPVTVRPN